MARKKAETKEVKIANTIVSLQSDIARWCFIRDNGCSDPSWADGVNMNLKRNHIINDKRQLVELIGDDFLQYPIEFFIPVPPEVPNNYMRYDGGRRGYKGVEMLSTYERDKPILDKWGTYEFAISEDEIFS